MTHSFDFAIAKAVTLTPVRIDKNGLESVLLDCIAGKMPVKRVISGTIAEGNFEVGKTYAVSITQDPSNEYGDQFTFKAIDTLSGIELIKMCREFGKPQLIDTEANATPATPAEVVITGATPAPAPTPGS